MTIMAAEAGAGAAEAGAAEASAGARQAAARRGRAAGRTPIMVRRPAPRSRGQARTGGRTQQASQPKRTTGGRTGGRSQQGTQGGRTVQGGTTQYRAFPRSGGRTQQGSQPRRTGGRTQQGTQGGRSVTPGPIGRQGGSQRRSQPGRRPRVTIDKSGGTSYQTVVLAEFVAAILLVAATPFAKKQSAGVSPYVGADLVQLVMLTLVYFILALISGANRGAGRFAAWFGALILLTVGIAEAARLAKLLNVFGLSSAPGSTGTSQAPGTHTAGGRGA